MTSTLFISAGCAAKPNIAEWIRATNQIVFAINSDIGVAELDAHGDFTLSTTFFAHAKTVSCLKVVAEEPDICILLSGSVGGELCVWKFVDSSPQPSLIRRIDISNAPLNFVGGLLSQDGRCISLCAHEDFITIEFPLNSDEEYGQNVVHFKSAFVLCFDIITLDDCYILAVGLTNGTVELLYSTKGDLKEFVRRIALRDQTGWVRSLAFGDRSNAQSVDFSLAVAFDEIIRIWNFTEQQEPPEDGQLRIKPLLLEVGEETNSRRLEVKLDSVLSGHDGWIHSLRWHPTRQCLLSASMDKNVIVWKPSMADDVWLPAIRMGEVGGEAVGFCDALFSPEGNRVLFHSFFGVFYAWDIDVDEETASPTAFHVGGHFDSVSDFDWDPTGSYVLTCSLDKTTRIFAPLKKSGVFVEIARPQIHGHALNCIKSINSVSFVSGAEEKIFRAFHASSIFVANMKTLCGTEFGEMMALNCMVSVPELGLSNKLNAAGDEEADSVFNEPPRNDELSKRTLFPEVYKLYGHGYEVFAITANHVGSILVTACKASHEEHASLLVWDTAEWQLRSNLSAHKLTVTQMAFSPDDEFMLSVSRDRTWCLSKIEKNFFSTICVQSSEIKGGHTRIIWACAWSHDSQFFATVSRDKTLSVWKCIKSAEYSPEVVKCGTFVSHESITAVDFAPAERGNGNYLIAIGHNDGRITLIEWYYNATEGVFTPVEMLDQNLAFSGTITRIRHVISEEL